MWRRMLATETNKQILIVDRDVAAVEPLRQRLGEVGFIVRAIADGSAAISAVAERPPHLVIIDWNMPGLAALEADSGGSTRARAAGGQTDHPLGAVGRAGCGDGLEPRRRRLHREAVLLAGGRRQVSVLLRAHPQDLHHPALSCDDLVLDASTNRVTAHGRLLNLRGVEYRLLEFLMSHRGRTFNRTQLLAQVWGDDSEVDERTVDVNVQRLRKILTEPGYEAYIQTVRGFGYRFAAPGVARVE